MLNLVNMTFGYVGAIYDGTNAAELMAQINGAIVSETGGVLTYEASVDPLDQYVVHEGNYLFWNGDQVSNSFEAANPLPLSDLLISPHVTGGGFQAAGGGGIQSASFVESTGSGSVAAVPLGGTQNVDVTLSEDMGGTGYVPDVFLRGTPSVLSGHGITNVTVLSSTQVRVTLSSAVGSLAGGSVFVVARKLVIT